MFQQAHHAINGVVFAAGRQWRKRMSDHYEVIESWRWENLFDGRKASIYGAVPWQTREEEKEWRKVKVGWTVRNPLTGEVGIGRPPCKTFAEACELALKLGKPSRINIGD